jgi:hypothetical protein
MQGQVQKLFGITFFWTHSNLESKNAWEQHYKNQETLHSNILESGICCLIQFENLTNCFTSYDFIQWTMNTNRVQRVSFRFFFDNESQKIQIEEAQAGRMSHLLLIHFFISTNASEAVRLYYYYKYSKSSLYKFSLERFWNSRSVDL